ncbi:hypothetical protein B8V81_1576 [Paenibacillus pasadenensis]|uniref:Uncharacterized protein n=1 Tax=Paenibacillus pasadenensis TaxID=217090 RepID=A0A2N5NAI0_9BACL|nr:hypothetical protein B8V81_1576 [Paenibacillus pasadenensis]
MPIFHSTGVYFENAQSGGSAVSIRLRASYTFGKGGEQI